MTPKICHRQRESQIRPHGNPESKWPQHALEGTSIFACFGDRAGFAGHVRLAPDPLQHRPERVPRYHGIDLDQRVPLRIQARITIRKIKENHLRHDNQRNVSYQRPYKLTSAQERAVMEAMALGSFAKKFHALQQASTMSSQLSKTVMASLLARR